MPGKVIKGFEDDKGLMVSNPSLTAWMPSNKPKPRNFLHWDTARNWKRVLSENELETLTCSHPTAEQLQMRDALLRESVPANPASENV